MTDTPTITRPVPRWVRAWAVLTVVAAVVLLALGGFVTSFRVGMADPVPFTEPWYLFHNDKFDLGYRIEHSHRIAGWAVGGAVVVLALGAFAYEPDRRRRWFGLVAVVLLVAAYGEFRRDLSRAWEAMRERVEAGRPAAAEWPVPTGAAAGVLAAAVVAAGGLSAAGGRPGGWVRAAAAAGLVLVMAQGLLGGLRVFLNELVGTDLAAVHGVFAQVTFCALVAAAIFAAPRHAGDALPDADRPPLLWLTWGLVGLTLVQLVWAVMVRHQGSAVAQRLHILTAFAVTGVVVWLAVSVLGRPPAKARLGGPAVHLLGLLALQLLLGVEAYMGKFAATGPEAYKPPTERTVTVPQAGIRTAHQLVGTGLLAAAVALALRAGRQPVGAELPPAGPDDETRKLNPRRAPAPAGVP